VLSKLVAGREKDLRYARDAARCGLVRITELHDRLATMMIDPAVRAVTEQRLRGLAAG